MEELSSAEHLRPYEPWNPNRFLDQFDNIHYKHRKRQKVYKYTLNAIHYRQYIYIGSDGTEKKVTLNLNDVQSSTIFYDQAHRPDENTSDRRYDDMKIEVWDSDTIDAAKRIIDEEGERPIVLNMASYSNPGGGVTGGSGAQEENLFRRSDYCRSLYQYMDYAHQYQDIGVTRNPAHTYPLDKLEGAVYSPGITVFRGNEAEGYPFLPQPFVVDFVAIAASCFRQTHQPHVYTPEEEQVIRHKINLLLRICKATGHSHLVLSALGCGAFHNPPTDVSRFFREALASEEFSHAFRHVVFAIMDDGQANGNYQVFKKEIG